MRLPTISMTLLLLAGCASQPQEPAAEAPKATAAATAASATTPATPASATPAPATPAGATSPSTAQTAAVKSYPGYKAKQRDGATVYCKKMAKIGSNFTEEYCMSGAEMERLESQAEDDRAQFRRNQTLCGTGGCGGT